MSAHQPGGDLVPKAGAGRHQRGRHHQQRERAAEGEGRVQAAVAHAVDDDAGDDQQVHQRLGLAALRLVDAAITPALTLRWVDQELHRLGMSAVLLAARRGLSLVDCISFEIMRREGIDRAFAFDKHFREQGYAFAHETPQS